MCPFEEDDPVALKPKAIKLWYQHEDLKKKSDVLEARVKELEEKLKAKNSKPFKPKSERTPKTAKDTDTSSSETVPEQEPEKNAKVQTGHGPTEQPKLEAVVSDYSDPPKNAAPCTNCGGELQPIEGEFQEREVIDIGPSKPVRVRERRQRFACICGRHEAIADGPLTHMDNGRYTLDFAIHAAIEKYADRNSLEHQTHKLRREGLDIESQTLWDQIDKLAFWTARTTKAIREYLVSQPVLGADETTWKLLGHKGKKAGYHASKVWQMWVAQDEYAAYFINENNHSHVAADKLLKDFRGTLMCDGLSAYKKLSSMRAEQNMPLRLAYCWSHVRRNFWNIKESFKDACGEILQLINRLFFIEQEWKKEPETLSAKRASESSKILEEIGGWVFRTYGQYAPGSGLCEAIRYMGKHWEGLCLFLTNVSVPLHNNASENAIRESVIGRKLYYGSKSVRGCEVAAQMYTMLETAERAGLSPRAYLKISVLRALRGEAPVLAHEVTLPMLMTECGMSEALASAAFFDWHPNTPNRKEAETKLL